jgi:hypothetical protein
VDNHCHGSESLNKKASGPSLECTVCTENLIRVDEVRELPRLTRWLRCYGLS